MEPQTTTAPTASGPTDLPVSEAFGPALWSAEIVGEPILTSNRVVYLDGEQVRALDASGEQVWEVSWSGPAITTMQGTYPHLRLVSPDTVALLNGGRSEGEGLSTATFSINVTLIKVEDGSTKVVNIPVQGASGAGMPAPDSLAASFALPEDDSMGADLLPTAVLATGEVHQGPVPQDERVSGASPSGTTCFRPGGQCRTGSPAMAGTPSPQPPPPSTAGQASSAATRTR